MNHRARVTGDRRRRLSAKLARALRRDDGAVAIQFAILALPLAVVAFGLYDLNQASVAKRELQDALDAATLMAARSGAITNAGLQSAGSLALKGELSSTHGVTLTSSSFSMDSAKIVGTAHAKLSPIIANLWLQGDMDVRARSEVVRGMNKLEVVLVLDNTGSMSGSKLTNLKTAAKNLIDTLSAASANSTEPDAVKIGVVPFSQTVRIDPSYKTASWMDKSAVSPVHSEIFSSATNRFTLFNNLGVAWAGCVESRPYPYDVQDTTPASGNKPTLFVPYFAPDEPDSRSKSNYKNADFGDFDNDYLPDEKYSTSNWKIPQGYVGKYDQSPSGSGKGPNRGCDMQPLMRLSTNWTALKSLVNNMNATGNTNIGMGAMWGWHLLSPNKPFADGVAYGTPKTSKIAIIMTDGDNTFADADNDNRSIYNGLGYIWQDRIDTTSNSQNTRTAKMDARLKEVCANMKAKGIVVYTVRVEVSSGSSSLLSGCATSADKFYDVQNAADLNAVFQNIAGEIAALRISK